MTGSFFFGACGTRSRSSSAAHSAADSTRLTACASAFSAPVGTATSLHSPGSYRGLIAVSLSALPPNLSVGVRRHLLGRECTISVRMPLGRNIWKPGGQIIFPRHYLFPRTDWAAISTRDPRCHCRLPFVPLFTAPPYFTVAARCHLIWRYTSVSVRMPLPGHFRKVGRQIILSRADLAVSADGATAAGSPGFDLGPPFMTFFSDPPDHFVAARQHLFRSQRRVFDRMPLLCKLRAARSKVILTCLCSPPGTHRAVGPAACTGIHRCPPFVPLFTAPPDFAFTPVRDLLWSQ